VNMWKHIELEWKILILAAALLVALAVPVRMVFVQHLTATLKQSVDPALEGLLRQRLDTATGAERDAIVASLERSRQWQALIPIIVREQRQAVFGFTLLLSLGLSLVAVLTLRRLTRPLRSLAASVQKIGHGERTDVKLVSGGALGTLEHAVSALQEELGVLREQAQVKGMELAWQDIARVMAHEIKNPLTPIRLTLDRIDEKLAADETIPADDMQRFIDRINAQTDVLERLVNQFRSFSREPEVRLAPVRIHESIATMAGDLSASLRTTIKGSATVAADPYLLAQVLLNVWKNALEAGADTIRVRIESTHTHVDVAVTDNGAGIPPDELGRVWLPYVSLKKGGTGLGLPVVKKLMETMGGSVSLTSSADARDHGVTVTLRFAREIPA